MPETRASPALLPGRTYMVKAGATLTGRPNGCCATGSIRSAGPRTRMTTAIQPENQVFWLQLPLKIALRGCDAW